MCFQTKVFFFTNRVNQIRILILLRGLNNSHQNVKLIDLYIRVLSFYKPQIHFKIIIYCAHILLISFGILYILCNKRGKPEKSLPQNNYSPHGNFTLEKNDVQAYLYIFFTTSTRIESSKKYRKNKKFCITHFIIFKRSVYNLGRKIY